MNFRLSEYLLLTKENNMRQLTNLKNTGIDKTWTSHISCVNRLCVLTIIHSWLYSCTFFTYLTLLYIFLYMSEIKHTLVDLMWGHIEVPGKSVTVCTWSHNFPLHDYGWSEHSLWHSAQSHYLHSGDQAHAHTFPPKVDVTSSECQVMRAYSAKLIPSRVL